MPKNSQQDQKQARQKKNSKGAQAQGTQCRDRDQRQSSASPGILSLQVRPVLLSASFPSPFPEKGCGHACHPSPVPGIG